MKSQARRKYIQYGPWVVVLAAVILIWSLVQSDNRLWYAMLPLLLILVFPYVLRPILMRMYFENITPKESILPMLRYFEASGNPDHFKFFLKFVKEVPEEELIAMEKKLYEYLVPALAFNFSRLPDDWEEKITSHLKITKEDFETKLIDEYRSVLLQTAVHSAQPNISKFIFNLSERANDEKLIADYIKEITSPEIVTLDDDEINTIYKKLLEDLYLYDELFYDYCDKLGLEKEKALIEQLVARFVPPPVPKNQLEAVMTTEQLIEKREKEKIELTEPVSPPEQTE
jgi:hypothetical protein